MIAFALSNWRLILIGVLVAAVAVQELRVRWIKSEFVTYRAEIERQIAENKVRNAQEVARQALNQKEALDALQGRFNALNARYKRLRDSASPSGVPALSSAAPVLSACPGDVGKPDSLAGRLEQMESAVLGILEKGDREIAKYVELWRLQKRNADGRQP